VEAVQAAVSRQEGTVDLYLSPDLNVDHRTYASEQARTATPVRAVSLDSYLSATTTVDFIKMDIQGAEYDALLGMTAIIARSPRLTLVMELWPAAHDRFGAGTAALLALIESWGLAAYRIRGRSMPRYERLTRDSPIPERRDPEAYFDILCTRPNESAHV
jgi:hypothetical protein